MPDLLPTFLTRVEFVSFSFSLFLLRVVGGLCLRVFLFFFLFLRHAHRSIFTFIMSTRHRHRSSRTIHLLGMRMRLYICYITCGPGASSGARYLYRSMRRGAPDLRSGSPVVFVRVASAACVRCLWDGVYGMGKAFGLCR